MLGLTVSLLLASLSLGPLTAPVQKKKDRPSYFKYLSNHIEEEEAPTAEDIRSKDELREPIGRIGAAFEAGNASELEDCLVRSRIFLSLRAKGDQKGFFGPSQIKFMFDRLFEQRETRAFTYDSKELDFARDGSVSFEATWTYVLLDEDELVTELLRFKMERSGDDWRVSEIRSTPR
jgi:hypothetical protein